MKDTDIVEILPDGTVYHFDLDVCDKAANRALEQLYEKEGAEIGFDYTAAIFSLFISSIQILSESGWNTRELLEEVITHSAAEDNCDCDD